MNIKCEWLCGGRCEKDDDICDGNCDGHMVELEESNFDNNETRLDSVKAKLKRKAKRQLAKLSRRKLEI